MNDILIGCGQITWSQFTPQGADRQAMEEQVLAEIAQAGYDGAPAGPSGVRTPEQTLELYGRYGLRPAPGYIGAPFWERQRRDEILARVREQAQFAQAVGCTELYLAPGGSIYRTRGGQTRRETAGRVRPEDSLSDEEYRVSAATLDAAGSIALEYGARICLHNHVGEAIETRAEVERLLSLTDPSLVYLGPDTGHLAWAGADPVAFFRDHLPRIKTLHLKDIDGAVRDQGRAAGWDYDAFSANGVFVELGEGMVDIPAILGLLRDAGFRGWLIVETDVPNKPTPLESITVSREYLHDCGV